MIQGGSYDNKKIFESETFDIFNTCYYCEFENRSGVGFDKPQIEGKHGSTFGGVSKIVSSLWIYRINGLG
ncbi:MAG: hypothetical protein CM15mP102_16840 [Flavobacteriales bacterium]|nr:MAG: hypothetical protein CM15mP102_16840 [Flavobacteriales bacterium]